MRLAEGDIVSVEAFAHSCIVTTIHEKLEVKSSISELENCSVTALPAATARILWESDI